MVSLLLLLLLLLCRWLSSECECVFSVFMKVKIAIYSQNNRMYRDENEEIENKKCSHDEKEQPHSLDIYIFRVFEFIRAMCLLCFRKSMHNVLCKSTY